MTAKFTNKQLHRALEAIAEMLYGKLEHGRSFAGTLHYEDLVIDTQMTVRRSIDHASRSKWLEEAMDLLEREGWRDRCGCRTQSKRRSYSWSRSSECSKPVTFVLRFASGSYDFRCAHHVDKATNPAHVTATLKLDRTALTTLRTKRKRERDRRDELARLRDRGVIIPNDNAEVDTAIECALHELARVGVPR